MTDITLRAAHTELEAWRAAAERVAASRDETVTRALEAGVTPMEIHRRTGLARDTIARIGRRRGTTEAEAALAALRAKLAGDE